MLTDGQIKKYQTLFEKKFGEKISNEEAVYQGEKLVQLIKYVYKINIKKNER